MQDVVRPMNPTAEYYDRLYNIVTYAARVHLGQETHLVEVIEAEEACKKALRDHLKRPFTWSSGITLMNGSITMEVLATFKEGEEQ